MCRSKRVLSLALLFLLVCIAQASSSWAQEIHSEVNSTLIVNDVTQLNPIVVAGVVTPHRLDELVEVVKGAKGPISIGGGRFSMGGQTATEQTTQLDMREFNKVLAFSPDNKEITVQSGVTWRQIQALIDPYNLSVMIMQTYSDFSVGGSLSVNAHGRYIGYGPLVLSVKRMGIVLADGSYVDTSPTQHADIFFGAIGGYGGIGVITDVTLGLADNVKVHRVSQVMPFIEYKDFFFNHVRNNPKAIFHNADIYPNAYDTVRATTYEQTDLPVTREARLIPKGQNYGLDKLLFSVISEVPGGKAFRQHILDPLLFSDDRVTWRNYEASYTVLELEPTSRQDSSYVLQEYFIPVERIAEFVPKMAKILNDNQVNMINVSMRHAKPDTGTALSWAKQEVFAFVLYYKQGKSIEDREHVGVWARELIDAAISVGGRYYLPYQIHATAEQFKAAYPGWQRLFDLKKRVDPANKFRNKLWDAYYLGNETEAMSDIPNSIRAYLATIKDYRRDESSTFLTMPEWFLVYSPDEYAKFIVGHAPSAFPYFGSISQFWGYYADSIQAARDYPFNQGYHLMDMVIGSSFTLENLVKGAYENTIGRISELTKTGDQPIAEEQFAIETANDYVTFIRLYPWYEYDFWSRFKGLWIGSSLTGKNMIRKWERKGALSAEYLLKAAYASVIKWGAKAAYGDTEEQIYAIVRNLPDEVHFSDKRIRVVKRFEHAYSLVSLPRYEAFMGASQELLGYGATFVEIAGNRNILATVIANNAWQPSRAAGERVYERPILTAKGLKRLAIKIDVRNLQASIQSFKEAGITLEHIYDY